MRSNLTTIIIAIFLSLGSCSSKIDGDPQIEFYKGNSLLPVAKFKTPEASKVFVEYWEESSPNDVLKTIVSEGTDHNLFLFNISELTKYRYTINSDEPQWKSEEYEFTTKEIPSQAFKVDRKKIDSTVFDGYVLVRRLSEFGADAIINNRGEIVWYHLYDTLVRRAFTWTSRNTILSIYDSARIVEVDLKGDMVLDINLEQRNVPNKLHHEILYNEDGNIASLTLDSGEVDLRKYGGKSRQSLRADGILLTDNKGAKLWEWNILDVAKPLMNSLGVHNLDQSWGHANSFAIDQDGHYVVSFKEFDQVWKINSQSGSIMWRLGANGDFKMQPDDYFMGQHSVYYTDKGELMMFDNGSRERPNSRVLAFRLDEKNMTATASIKVTLPVELSAYRMGSVVLVAPGKYLVCTTRGEGTISVVDDLGNVLWQVVLNNPSYRAYYIQEPFQNFAKTKTKD